MLITFLRHATAEDRSLSIPDADRALTDKGEKQVKRLAAFCQSNRLMPGIIFVSPLLRAQQTAKFLQDSMPGCQSAQTADWLGMDSQKTTMLTELSKLAELGIDDIWLIGHEPDFSELIGCLMHTSAERIVVKKASLIRLEADFSGRPTANLLWSLPCSLMRHG